MTGAKRGGLLLGDLAVSQGLPACGRGISRRLARCSACARQYAMIGPSFVQNRNIETWSQSFDWHITAESLPSIFILVL